MSTVRNGGTRGQQLGRYEMSTDMMNALAARVKAKREDAGSNVRFVNERGQADEFSFATVERADAFRAVRVRMGSEMLA